MSNLTKENTGKVFGQGEARKFFTAGGTSILATQNVKAAQAQREYISNKVLSTNGKGWIGELRLADESKSLITNKAISKNQYLSSGEMSYVAPEKALEIVNTAEAQQATILARAGKEM